MVLNDIVNVRRRFRGGTLALIVQPTDTVETQAELAEAVPVVMAPIWLKEQGMGSERAVYWSLYWVYGNTAPSPIPPLTMCA